MDIKRKVRRLEQLRHLRREVNLLSQRIAELELAAREGTTRITGMPAFPRGGEGDADANVARLKALWEQFYARRERCMNLLGALYAFIDDIEDSRMRQIFTYRYIDGRTWQCVAMLIGEWDEQYPRRLHNRFLEHIEVPCMDKDDENDDASAE